MSFPTHPELAGRFVRLQGTAVDRRCLHGLGDAAREDSCTERQSVHWRVRVPGCNHECHCRGACELNLGTRHSGLHYDFCTDSDIDHGHTLPPLPAQVARHLAEAARSCHTHNGIEDGVQHETVRDG